MLRLKGTSLGEISAGRDKKSALGQWSERPGPRNCQGRENVEKWVKVLGDGWSSGRLGRVGKGKTGDARLGGLPRGYSVQYLFSSCWPGRRARIDDGHVQDVAMNSGPFKWVSWWAATTAAVPVRTIVAEKGVKGQTSPSGPPRAPISPRHSTELQLCTASFIERLLRNRSDPEWLTWRQKL